MTRLTDQERLWRSVPEKDVIYGILDHFARRGGYAFRNNTGGHWFSNPGSDDQRFVQFGSKGACDIIGILDGGVYFVEAKTELGKQSEDQIAWQQTVEACGGRYLLCRPSNYVEVIDQAIGVLS